MSFWAGVFSDNGSPSSSRVLTAIHTTVSCACLGYVTYHNKAVPDATTLVGLGTFSTVHYAVNAVKNVFQKSGGNGPNNSAT